MPPNFDKKIFLKTFKDFLKEMMYHKGTNENEHVT